MSHRMKNNTSLTYIGKVDIKIGRKRYTGYNSGYPELFRLLARFLAGETMDSIALPQYIKIERRASGSESSMDILYTPLVVYKQAKLVSTNWVTIVSTVLTDSNINTAELYQNYKYDLILYDHSIETRLASIEISYDTLSQILTGRQALIEWSLGIVNKTKE